MKIFGDFGSIHSSDELGFGGTCSDCGLELGLVGDGTTGKTEYNASKGAPCVSVSGVGRNYKANELQKGVLREGWERWIQSWLFNSNCRERVNWCTLPIQDTPMFSML